MHTLEQLLLRLRQERQLLFENEQAIRQGLVLPILSSLGWDRDNVREVVPEFAIQNGRVDYCLRIGERNQAFIEVKRAREDLECHQEQLLDYAFRMGIRLAALTNGFLWWLYLPLREGSWEERRFFTIDIQQQEAHAAADHFNRFLGRDAVHTGDAEKQAQSILQSKEREKAVDAAMPQAWRMLCEEPNEDLLDLLDKAVESVSGYRADEQRLADFLARQAKEATPLALSLTKSVSAAVAKKQDVPSFSRSVSPGYQNTRPEAFRFQGQRIPVVTFKDILLKLAEILHRSDPARFQQAMQLRGRKRTYFAHDQQGMKHPRLIPGSDIYAETNMSANSIVQVCRDLLRLLNYPDDEFEVEVSNIQA
jgi:negative regulator of replication initiation